MECTGRKTFLVIYQGIEVSYMCVTYVFSPVRPSVRLFVRPPYAFIFSESSYPKYFICLHKRRLG